MNQPRTSGLIYVVALIAYTISGHKDFEKVGQQWVFHGNFTSFKRLIGVSSSTNLIDIRFKVPDSSCVRNFRFLRLKDLINNSSQDSRIKTIDIVKIREFFGDQLFDILVNIFSNPRISEMLRNGDRNIILYIGSLIHYFWNIEGIEGTIFTNPRAIEESVINIFVEKPGGETNA